MDLVSSLMGQLSGNNLGALAQQLGMDEQHTGAAVQAALPMILGAMQRNASQPEGAQSLLGALSRDHDGSILDNLNGFLASPDNGDGPGILKHLFGANQQQVAAGVSQMSGIDSNQAMGLLQNLAPVVMGMLGRTQRQEGFDANGLSSLLGMAVSAMGGGSRSANMGQGAQALGMLNQLLDRDGDGNALDDVAGMLGNLFGKKR